MYDNATWPPRDTSIGHAFADIKLRIDEAMNIDIGLVHIRANAGPRWPITCGISTHVRSPAALTHRSSGKGLSVSLCGSDSMSQCNLVQD